MKLRDKTSTGPKALLVLITILALLMSNAGRARSSEAVMPGAPAHVHLMYDDLVVRGIIESATEELVPARSIQPLLGASYEGVSVSVCRVAIRVSEVLRGYYETPTISVIADGFKKDFFVPGQEMIAGVVYRPQMLQGCYGVFYRSSYYATNDAKWICEGVAYELTDIVDAVESVSVETLTTSATAVVVGVVESMRQYETRSETGLLAVIQEIQLRVEDVKRGTEMPSVVAVESIIGGSYWPAWRGIMPEETTPGDRLYLFLGMHGSTYRVVGGANGCLKVTSKGLVYNDSVQTGYSVDELDAKVAKVDPHGD